MALLKERDIERYLSIEVKKLGGEIRKVKWIGRNSAPDRRVMLPGLCCWVELKAPGKKPTTAQLREHRRMRAHGEQVHVLDTLAGINVFLSRTYMHQRRCPSHESQDDAT